MGNSLVCINPSSSVLDNEQRAKKKVSSSGKSNGFFPPPPPPPSSSSKPKKEELLMDDKVLAEQAMAAAMLFRQHQKNGNDLPFPRSTSVVYHSHGSNKKQSFTKSYSSRQRSLAHDPLLRPNQLLNQELKIDHQSETNHLILVHGGGFGAWCWYKIMTLLEESGFKVDAIDLTGSGTHSSDTNTIATLSHYIKPLIDILVKLKQGEKVILVGHDIGGACISCAMELFPSKIAKSVFISATMLSNGQSAFDILSQQTDSTDLMRQAQVFLYGNGKDNPPTAIDLDKAFLRDLLFNQTSPKDIALASVSMRPIPIAPVLEKLSLSDNNYGSVRRFYIKTQEDFAIPVSLQESMINSNPPEQVFQIKGSDHAPFFSKPQALHRILIEILQILPK
ncbi:hypothetical protein JCGZ_15725 [Jatropha curcas]|uniref:AB hydrolase-1 domain-containing protein n=1 Tax=Jatropha curcas TaxID=180498 RepID=A0A067L283_JATCU|nr:putative methylesterase 11, chloroplastic [Jatropha curcas]KDP41318.1 hypothetical protein JCGZ_15725 [Jatropha curcas]